MKIKYVRIQSLFLISSLFVICYPKIHIDANEFYFFMKGKRAQEDATASPSNTLSTFLKSSEVLNTAAGAHRMG